MNNELEVDGKLYHIGKLNALQQFHVSRRLAPVLAAVGITLQSLAQAKAGKQGDFTAAIGPAADVMAKMTDEEANYILFTCLSVVGRKDGDRRMMVCTRDGLMQYQDMDMPVMLRLVVAVLMENLGNFLPGLSDAVGLQSS